MYLRPATINDHDAVLELARQAGFGMTSLPPDAAVLRDKIEASVASFNGKCAKSGQESFFFVLEDADHGGHIAGTCGIKAHIGLSQPFYSYKLTTITQVSTQLDIFSKQTMLQVTNDLTGATEVGSLFLQPSYRRDRLGKMISLSRFMFMAAFPQYFSDQVIAEMRGVHDVDGNAPFYNALPKKFFEMNFAKADYINATHGNAGRCVSRGAIRRPPESGCVIHVAGQGKILIAERLHRRHIPIVFRCDGPQFRRADEQLPGQNAAGEQAENHEDDGEFHQLETVPFHRVCTRKCSMI
jgi:hypothetical protein